MSSASQEIPHILRNPEVHYGIHKNQPPVLILGQTNSVHALPLYFFKIHFNIILPYTPKSSKSSPSLRHSHPYPVCISPLPHTCYMPVHVIHLDSSPEQCFVHSTDHKAIRVVFTVNRLYSALTAILAQSKNCPFGVNISIELKNIGTIQKLPIRS